MRKLHNKKTGEVFVSIKEPIDLYYRIGKDEELVRKSYTSISELNDEWEDFDIKSNPSRETKHKADK